MTLQQLRYLIAIAEYGSINAAAQNLYASQSNLSTAIKELEQELGITVFTRSNRGVTLTNDGTELLGYARQVIEQADMLEMRYADKGSTHLRLAVSTQHYAFSVQAFVNVVEGCKGEEYEFILRESTTPRSSTTCARSAAKWASCTPTTSTGACCRRRSTTPTWPTLPCSTRACTCSWASTTRWRAPRCCDPTTWPTTRATRSSRALRIRSTIPKSRSATCRTSATSASPTAARSPTC